MELAKLKGRVEVVRLFDPAAADAMEVSLDVQPWRLIPNAPERNMMLSVRQYRRTHKRIPRTHKAP